VAVDALISPLLQEKSLNMIKRFSEKAVELDRLNQQYADYSNPSSGFLLLPIHLHYRYFPETRSFSSSY
jgi:hypothetical protein